MRQDRIIRAPRNSEHPYMQLMRKIPQDTRMTLEERGFLIYMLSLPAAWEANPAHLCRTQGIGEKKLRSIFKKLQSLGYCQVSQIRDSNGKFSHNEYLIFEDCIDTPSDNECEPSGNSCRAAETAGPFLPDGDQEQHTYTQREDTIEYINTPPTPASGEAAKAARVCGSGSSKKDRIAYGSFVKLTPGDYKTLCDEHSESTIKALIEEMDDYCASCRPKGYSDYFSAIRQWMRRRKDQPTGGFRRLGQVDRRTRNMDGTPVDAPHLKDLF